MTRIFAILLATISATATSAQACFPLCNTNKWKSVQCGALCNEHFWTDATAADVQEILASGRSVNENVDEGWEPIHFAANFGTVEGVLALLEAGANPDGHALRLGIETPLFGVVNSYRSQFRNAISADNIHSENRYIALTPPYRPWPFSRRYPPLYDEAELNRITPIVSALIAAGADFDRRGNKGLTLLLFSLETGNVEIAKILVEVGADVNVVDDAGASTLHHTVKLSDGATMAQILIDAGTDPDQLSVEGETVLFRAVVARNVALVNALIDAGADISLEDSRGRTPFSYLEGDWVFEGNNYEHTVSRWPKHAELAELLLQAGAAATGTDERPAPPEADMVLDSVKYPLLKEYLDGRGDRREYSEALPDVICTQRTRKGTEVREVVVPCPSE